MRKLPRVLTVLLLFVGIDCFCSIPGAFASLTDLQTFCFQHRQNDHLRNKLEHLSPRPNVHRWSNNAAVHAQRAAQATLRVRGGGFDVFLLLSRLMKKQPRQPQLLPPPLEEPATTTPQGHSSVAKTLLDHVKALGDEKCAAEVIKLLPPSRPSSDGGGLLGRLFRSLFGRKGVDCTGTEWYEVLSTAASRGMDKTVRALVAGGLCVDERGRHGQTALHLAAAKGRDSAVRALCELGADVEAADLLGWTALHQAAFFGRLSAARVLVEGWHARPGSVNSEGHTPADLAEAACQRSNATRMEMARSTALPQDERVEGKDATQASWEEYSNLLSMAVFLRRLVPAGSAHYNASDAPASSFAGLLRRITALHPPQVTTSARVSPADLSQHADTSAAPASSDVAAVEIAASDSMPGEPPQAAAAAEAEAEAEAEAQEVEVGVEVEGGKGGQKVVSGGAKAKPAGEKTGQGEMCGVGITLNVNLEGEFFVKSMAESGAAARSGQVQHGDVLEKVDGKGVQGISYSELASWILGPAGTSIHFTFRRGGASAEVALTRVALGEKEKKAVADGIAKEKSTLQQMMLLKQRLEMERKAMAEEIDQLRLRAENAENEARVWKAISQQNSAAASKNVSPGTQSPAASDLEDNGRPRAYEDGQQ